MTDHCGDCSEPASRTTLASGVLTVAAGTHLRNVEIAAGVLVAIQDDARLENVVFHDGCHIIFLGRDVTFFDVVFLGSAADELVAAAARLRSPLT